MPYVSFDFSRQRDSGRVCELINLPSPPQIFAIPPTEEEYDDLLAAGTDVAQVRQCVCVRERVCVCEREKVCVCARARV